MLFLGQLELSRRPGQRLGVGQVPREWTGISQSLDLGPPASQRPCCRPQNLSLSLPKENTSLTNSPVIVSILKFLNQDSRRLEMEFSEGLPKLYIKHPGKQKTVYSGSFSNGWLLFCSLCGLQQLTVAACFQPFWSCEEASKQ